MMVLLLFLRTRLDQLRTQVRDSGSLTLETVIMAAILAAAAIAAGAYVVSRIMAHAHAIR